MKNPVAIAALTACCLTAMSALAQTDFSQANEDMDSFKQQMQTDALQSELRTKESELQDQKFEADMEKSTLEGDLIIQQQQGRQTLPVERYNPEAAVAAGIEPSLPIEPRPEQFANLENAETAYRHARDRYDQEMERYNNAHARWEQQEQERAKAEQLREINRETLKTLEQEGVQTQRNPETGMVEPVRNASGNLVYRPAKAGPVQYDQSGRPYRIEQTETGPSVVELDKEAPIGPHPQRPNELYKQNKFTPWEYLGTVQEGLHSSDKEVQGAARNAQLALDKRLHADAGNDLAQSISQLAQNVNEKVEDFRRNSALYKQKSDELARFDQDHPGLKDKAWLFGPLTPQAKALQEQKSDLQKQIEDLKSKGYSLDPADLKAQNKFTEHERARLKEAGDDLRAWRAATPKEFGDFDKLIQQRTAEIEGAGRDPADDPILASLEKRKAALGIGVAGQPAEAAEDEALRQHPITAPLMQERDNLDQLHKDANDELTNLGNEYTQKLERFEQEVRTRQNQIAPLEAEAQAYRSRLEELVGMVPVQQGEDLTLRAQERENRISQVTDPKLSARIQTLIDQLNPVAQEVAQRQAELDPHLRAYEELQQEGANAWQQRHDELESNLAPLREDWQNRFDAAVHQKELAAKGIKWLNKITQIKSLPSYQPPTWPPANLTKP